MGLADFLAQAGRGTVVGNVAQAFGGQTTGQQMLNDQAKREHDFVNNQLPALLQEIQANTDENQIRPLGNKFMLTALQAGIPLKGAENLMEKMIGPALNGVRQEGLNKLRDQYAAQPGLEASPRNESSPSLVKGPNVPATPPLPERPLDLNFAMKFGQLTGANPEQFNKMLETPGLLTSKLLSNKKTQGEIDKETQAQQQRLNLPNTPLGPGQPSLQDIGVLAPAQIGQTLPAREKPEDPLLEERRNLLNAQASRDSALALKAAQGPASGGVSPYQQFNEESRLRTDFNTQSKNFQQIRDSYNRIMNAADTPAGGIVALMSFSKAMDPGARVTDQDFKTVQSAKPFLDRIGVSVDAVKSLWEGSKMTPGMWRDIKGRAQGLYDAEARQHKQRVNEFSRIAAESGLNPSRVITNMEATGEAPSALAGQGGYSAGPSGSGSGSGQGGGQPPPAPGTIYKGHRFKGGDPHDQNNWIKVPGQ